MGKNIKDIEFFNNSIAVDVGNLDNFSNLQNPNYILKYPNFYFGSFVEPKMVHEYNAGLNIVLDHSFDYSEKKDFIFIDHHLTEAILNIPYSSNADLMVQHYKDIYICISEIMKLYNYENITVYIHFDVDGIASGLIMKKILLDLSTGTMDNNFETAIKLAQVFGNYGDIDKDAKAKLVDLFSDTESIDIFDKKIKGMCKTLSRYMKAVRSLVTDDDYMLRMIERRIEEKIDNLSIEMIKESLYNIANNISHIKTINTKTIIDYFNIIMQNSTINYVLDYYNKEIENIIKSYTETDSPSIEMTIIFNDDKTKTKYKLFTIDTPFDCGRSVLWKYKSSLRNMLRIKPKVSPWYYKVTDWYKKKDLESLSDNAICYNKCLNKISLDSQNNSAYDIAKNIFDGGGHNHLDGGNASLGSAMIPQEEIFYNSYSIYEIF